MISENINIYLFIRELNIPLELRFHVQLTFCIVEFTFIVKYKTEVQHGI